MSRPITTPREQFQRRISVNDVTGCWEWAGGRTSAGYGLFTEYVEGRTRTSIAHRWSYKQFVGAIPNGLVLDHLCRNRACVNPAHLEPVTQAENIARGAAATKTECKHGHEYTPANTGRTAKGRFCRRCKADRESLRRLALKAAS